MPTVREELNNFAPRTTLQIYELFFNMQAFLKILLKEKTLCKFLSLHREILFLPFKIKAVTKKIKLQVQRYNIFFNMQAFLKFILL